MSALSLTPALTPYLAATGGSALASGTLLAAVILIPIVTAVVVVLLPADRPETAKLTGLFGMLAALAVAVVIVFAFDSRQADYQMVQKLDWIPRLGISWYLGIDGISLWMVVLSALLFPISLLGPKIHGDVKSYVLWMLILEGACMGSFLALDLFLFFLFFELVLLPMYMLIAGYGYSRRSYASLKFYGYTAAGSAFLLVGILAVAARYAATVGGGRLSFALPDLMRTPGISGSVWMLVFFMIAFCVKVPLFPVHTWLPDAHTEAPTAGSIILAGVLLKLGTYGMLRFGINLFPEAAVKTAPIWMVLALIGMIYGAIVAAMQPDLKRIIAYSSVAHMGFIVLGIFAFTRQAGTGAVIQMVNHGVTTPALFLLVGWIYERRHTREIAKLNGLWKAAPMLGSFFLVSTFASIGVPGLNGFVGEFLVLIGTFPTHPWFAAIGATAVIFAALYMLWAFQRVFMGEPDADNAPTPDLRWTQRLLFVPLLVLMFFMGVYPKPFTDRIQPSVDVIVARAEGAGAPKAPEVTRSTQEARP